MPWERLNLNTDLAALFPIHSWGIGHQGMPVSSGKGYDRMTRLLPSSNASQAPHIVPCMETFVFRLANGRGRRRPSRGGKARSRRKVRE